MKRIIILLFILLLPVLIGCTKKVGKIAFTSNRDGNDEIYVMNDDGTNQTNLTKNPGNDWYPNWSPDGKWLSYLTYEDEKVRPEGALWEADFEEIKEKLLQ